MKRREVMNKIYDETLRGRKKKVDGPDAILYL